MINLKDHNKNKPINIQEIFNKKDYYIKEN
jgi:hypothetical protein